MLYIAISHLMAMTRKDIAEQTLRTRGRYPASNPANAEDNTIRKQYGESVEANSVHGSDAPETAAVEMAYFFAGYEITG